MTFNPYSELGVPKDAPPEAARKAYRRRAKKVHPDAGGKPEDFLRLNRALAIVVDPARRERFDKTGADDDSSIPTIDMEAIGIIMGIINQAVAGWAKGDRSAVDLETRPILNDLEGLLTKAITGIKDAKRVHDRHIKKLRGMAARLARKKSGPSTLIMALEGEANRIEVTALAKVDLALNAHKRALEIVRDHTFNAASVSALWVPTSSVMTW